MDNPINYTTEARRINELVSMEDRENAYASFASRLREERDAAKATVDRLDKLLKDVRWKAPQAGQLPFARGYNLAMTQVNRAMNGEAE